MTPGRDLRPTSRIRAVSGARRVRWLLAVVVAMVLPALALARATAAPHPTPTAVAPQSTLRLVMPDATPTVDPALVADEANAQLASLLYGGLVRLDAQYHPVPASAEKWTLSSDHRTYTFYLRRGLRFSNGDPVTASDFAFAINRSLNPTLKSPSAPTYLLDISGAGAVLAGKAKTASGIKVLNSQTLQITVRWPVPYFLTELTYPTSFALDRKRLSKIGPVDSTAWYTNPIGSGPYKLKSWVPNSGMVLVPNPYFPEKKAAIKVIVISLTALPSTDIYQYVTTNLDVAMLPVEDSYLRKKADVHETKMLAIDGIYMNFHSKPLDNIHVRRALIMALPRTKIVRAAMGNLYTPFQGYVPPGESGYDAHLRPIPYDAKSGQRELAAAGFPNGKKFPALTLYYPDDPLIAKLTTGIAAAWQKNLHITVDTRALTLNTLLAKVQNGTLPLYIGGWSADYPDPHDWLSLQWRSDAVNNNVHYADASFDKKVETADVTWGYSQRMHLYDQAQQTLVNDVAWIPLYIPHRLAYIRSSVSNLILTGYGVIPKHGDWAAVRIASMPSGRSGS